MSPRSASRPAASSSLPASSRARPSAGVWRPTAAEVAAAGSRRVPDVIGPRLRVLFVGINPGLYSAAVGHHFARPGNRFWPVLELAGFTPGRLSPFDEAALLALGVGITNIAPRTTATAAELSRTELTRGAARLAATIRAFEPRTVAVLGVTAYRAAFGVPKAALGRQPEPLAGAPVWVLPNPSGLNAHYQLADLAAHFRALREATESGT